MMECIALIHIYIIYMYYLIIKINNGTLIKEVINLIY